VPDSERRDQREPVASLSAGKFYPRKEGAQLAAPFVERQFGVPPRTRSAARTESARRSDRALILPKGLAGLMPLAGQPPVPATQKMLSTSLFEGLPKWRVPDVEEVGGEAQSSAPYQQNWDSSDQESRSPSPEPALHHRLLQHLEPRQFLATFE